jgi:adenine-specific DNA-methyltransferase
MPILHWLDKDKHITTASKAPYRLLKLDPALSYGDKDTKNMIIQGDNLDALKALLPYYANSVKCIFIDPPYNTRSAFEHYDDNLEHTKWLEMMYPRLELLRELLAENGSIWITLDDNEAHYLKVIMDEIFGRKNFFANCVWQKKHTRANDARYLSDNHDHIICFAKNKDIWQRNLLPRNDDTKGYTNPDNDPRGVWASGPCHVKTPNAKDIYEIITPFGRKLMPPSGTSWRFSTAKFQELIDDNRIYFGKDGNNVPRYKRFLTEVQDGLVPITLWLRDEVGDNQEAKQEIKCFNQDDVFSTPKPERLIERILHIATNPHDIVLDSFLGSGTTAAVAHKMGRQYIGIEMGEHAKTHCVERLKKVTQGEQGGISKAVNWQGGGGFAFYHLGESIFDDDGRINADIKFYELASHIWFSETKTPLAKIPNTPLLGVHNNVAYYLLYNGILGDKRPAGGNVLTSNVFDSLEKHDGDKVIYGETCRMGSSRLDAEKIIFKQTPYDIKGR